jgi:hypothetical protein
MVKHILTTECPRSCSYCIAHKIKIPQAELRAIEKMLPEIYFQLSLSHKSIMITGGEPTQSQFFDLYISYARRYFEKVFITTQDEYLLGWKGSKKYFDAITFSWHDLKTWRYAVTNGATVYASILSHLYSEELIHTVKELGYSGLTINENHFGKDVFDENVLLHLKSFAVEEIYDFETANTYFNILLYSDKFFTIKINRRGECFKNDTVYIMPDLSMRESFAEYL